MTHVKPFRAFYFNPPKIKDFSTVVCPPYDVISKEQQNAYHNLSPHNFIRLELGKDNPRDDEFNNKYLRAQKTFEEWVQEGILKQDENPCIYFYKQEFKILGQGHSRLGFIALMKLQDEGDARIFPHENTHSSAKEDRFRLWSTLKMNLSPIFVCFNDKKKKVEQVFARHVVSTPPFIDLVDEEKVRHILWCLKDGPLITQIQEALEDQPLLIADGHHRYEVAQEYRRQRLRGRPRNEADAPHDYVLTYFTNMESKDLQVFPIHRVVTKLPRPLDFLEEFFRIDKISNRNEFSILLAKSGRIECSIGLYGRDGIKLLRLKNKTLINRQIQEGSEEYRQLDATILKAFILDRLGDSATNIIYTKDASQAMSMVDNHEAEVSFIMNPVKIHQIKAIALNGERMPPKTTYFYPKVLSGLTVYKLE